MDSPNNTIVTALHNLIDTSCATQDQYSEHYEGLHRAIIKKYFEAESVTINREDHTVTLEICVNEETKEMTYVDVDVNFDSFDKFLKSCIDDKELSLRFYKNTLRYYHVIEPLSA